MKKLYFLIAFLMLSAGALLGQSISVKSFKALPMDMTASSLEGKRIDQNGDVAALIKIVTTETGFTFEGGTLGIVDAKQETGELWVWVPRAARKITIKHQKFGVLRDYRYPIEIEAERTYEMVLDITKKPGPDPENQVRQQYLAFQISPANATLEVDDKLWTVGADGSAMKWTNCGTYSWRVQAPNYHTDAGNVTIDEPNGTEIVTVTLRPNFGWIEVAGNDALQGASVYVDNALIGRAPCKSEALKSGQHTVRIAKEMYDTYTETVTVKDNETTSLDPTLEADFAEVTLKVDAEAEIWVNNEKKGTRTWTGRLGSGTYKIECKQANHETSMTTQEITASMAGRTIPLPLPKPIYGSLNVESTPNFCKLYIDGKDIGVTPKAVPDLLIGSHQIRLTKDGYADYTDSFTLSKGEHKQIQVTLSNGKEIQFTCNVPDAQLEIDGQKVGSATGTYQLTYGSHSLKATATDYRDYTYTINVSESGSYSHSIQMLALAKDEETFTVNGVSFTMKLVEGGTFQMGATSEQGNDADSDEKPVHSVTLSNYYMGETEVTQALWKAVMGTEPSYNGGWVNDNGRGNDYPAYRVSWNDIQEFVTKLNRFTGKQFRLPTEAEWEYAARGGKRSNGYKYAGSSNIGSVAWYTDNSGSKTHPVKGKNPNELGLYDMSGNVWEWCQDWYDSYSNSTQTNPIGPSNGSFRVLRGGSWGNIARHCRVSIRFSDDPDIRDFSIGFRLVLPQ